ncbi:tigger transposable element-derived protein 6 [Elysia marginata]|uniref:Tigger transposable element-derived protein 6 n=1 Tax=Elysia marginata TaxID=1093978 RepID=A0AAV4FNX8_9GAST|nr:tigger transposable element-derived protein 6 [Elysia marginata]
MSHRVQLAWLLYRSTVFFVILRFSSVNGLTLEFMESLCGTAHTFDTSFQMDSGTGITYKNQLDCSLTVTAPAGHFVLALITRFELEAAVTGSCTDYLDIHNGSDTSAPKLNPTELCGWGTNIPSNLTSSGQSMTLRLVTDSTGVYHGFNIIFTAVYNDKKTKDRLTVLVIANMSATEKLYVIGKTAKPCCFNNVKHLPVNFDVNKKDWMTSNLFVQWLKKLDKKFLLQGKAVAMVVDNCPAHRDVSDLKAVKLVFLPPNTSNVLQGIINAFKRHYMKAVDCAALSCAHAPCTGTDFTCANQLCVDSSLRCDNYNQCGDNTDEDNCDSYGSSSGINVVMVAVIVAVVVVIIAVVAGVVIYKIRDRSRWKQFVNSHIDYDDDDGIVETPPSYPITYMYYKGVRGHPELFTAPSQEVKVADGSSSPSTEKQTTYKSTMKV